MFGFGKNKHDKEEIKQLCQELRKAHERIEELSEHNRELKESHREYYRNTEDLKKSYATAQTSAVRLQDNIHHIYNHFRGLLGAMQGMTEIPQYMEISLKNEPTTTKPIPPDPYDPKLKPPISPDIVEELLDNLIKEPEPKPCDFGTIPAIPKPPEPPAMGIKHNP
jgi:FtsZ-binding cell division protein ZapB